MSGEKAILGIAPTMQSMALLGGTMPRKKKRMGMGHIVGGATKILVGVPLIGATANEIAGMP